MRFTSKLVVGLTAGALLLGGGSAVAAGPKAKPIRGAVQAAAAYVGIPADQLRQELKSGKSLADVAVAHGKTQAGLETAIVADAKAHLDKAVAAGKLTSEQEAARLAKLQANVSKLVTHKGPPPKKARPAVRGAAKATATYLGLSLEQIRSELQSGKSLAEIATTHGKTVDGLEAAILADAKAAIATLVSSGKITSERGQKYLDAITKNIDRIVNVKRPAKG